MAVNRATWRKRWVVISKIAIEDTRLSWKARGMHAYLLSRPDNWNVIVTHLMKQSPDGRAIVLACIKELKEAGYITRLGQGKDEQGRFDAIGTTINEEPIFSDDVRTASDNRTRATAFGFPSTVPPSSENRTLMSTEEMSTEERTLSSNDKRAKKTFPAEVHDLCNQLADRIEGNGSLRPNITPSWLNVIERMIRIKGHNPVDIANVIDWCQSDSYWRANIDRPAKLNEHFDKLRLKAIYGMSASSNAQHLTIMGNEVDDTMSAFKEYFNSASEDRKIRSTPIIEGLLEQCTLVQLGRMPLNDLRTLVTAAARKRNSESKVA
jgi:hypothetical protein